MSSLGELYMNDTPRTDAKARWVDQFSGNIEFREKCAKQLAMVPAEFARELEREVNRLQRDNLQWQGALDELCFRNPHTGLGQSMVEELPPGALPNFTENLAQKKTGEETIQA